MTIKIEMTREQFIKEARPAAGLHVVPCLDCTDTICPGWKVVTQQEIDALPPNKRVRGPNIFGSVSNRYSIAFGLWQAAMDHKRTCGENCNVRLRDFRDAATIVIHESQSPASTLEAVDFNKWEWPL